MKHITYNGLDKTLLPFLIKENGYVVISENKVAQAEAAIIASFSNAYYQVSQDKNGQKYLVIGSIGTKKIHEIRRIIIRESRIRL